MTPSSTLAMRFACQGPFIRATLEAPNVVILEV
jgi:hypothetical protein